LIGGVQKTKRTKKENFKGRCPLYLGDEISSMYCGKKQMEKYIPG
jgi:hypothetical protein